MRPEGRVIRFAAQLRFRCGRPVGLAKPLGFVRPFPTIVGPGSGALPKAELIRAKAFLLVAA
jgi:hypothetical protein